MQFKKWYVSYELIIIMKSSYIYNLLVMCILILNIVKAAFPNYYRRRHISIYPSVHEGTRNVFVSSFMHLSSKISFFFPIGT